MRFWRYDLALTLMVSVALAAAPLTAGAVESDEGAADIDEDGLRSAALDVYYERCNVESGSARERYAVSDWANMVAAGSDPEHLLEVAELIPADCRYISFQSAILATERDLLRPPPEEKPPIEEARSAPSASRRRNPRNQALRIYQQQCGPLTDVDVRRVEDDYQELIDLRFPAFDDDDIRDNARRLPASCARESFRDGILRIELDRIRLRRNIGFIGGGVLIGLSSIAVVYSSMAEPCNGGLECLGPDLDRLGGLTLGIAGLVTGTILVLAGAGEQHNVERILRLLGESSPVSPPPLVSWNGTGVSVRF